MTAASNRVAYLETRAGSPDGTLHEILCARIEAVRAKVHRRNRHLVKSDVVGGSPYSFGQDFWIASCMVSSSHFARSIGLPDSSSRGSGFPVSLSTSPEGMIVVPFTSFATKMISSFVNSISSTIVGVRLIKLQHRELGIVLRRDALIAEVAIDLVDAIESADHQPLEIQLRRDAQEQIHVEGVVMRRRKACAAAPPAIGCIIGVSTSM